MALRDHLDEIQQMRADGNTLEEIGDKFGVSRERVRQLIGGSGGKRPKAEKRHRQIRAMVQDGVSADDISKAFGLSIETVYRIAHGLFKKSDVERFWAHVDKRGDDECWPWLGSRLPKGGHGRFMKGYAHRFSWELHSGQKVPDGLEVMHSCDHGWCVNPAHLRPGTHLENMQDRDAKGRGAFNNTRGSERKNSLLTEDKAVSIVAFYGRGLATQEELARLYGVKWITIHNVLEGRTWTHATGLKKGERALVGKRAIVPAFRCPVQFRRVTATTQEGN